MQWTLSRMACALLVCCCWGQVSWAQSDSTLDLAMMSIANEGPMAMRSTIRPPHDDTPETRWFGNRGLFAPPKKYPQPQRITGESLSVGWLDSVRPTRQPQRKSEHAAGGEGSGQNVSSLFQSSRESISGWASKSGAAIKSAREEIKESSLRTWESMTGSWRREHYGVEVETPEPPQRGPVNWYPVENER
jgi:hypothetical protein